MVKETLGITRIDEMIHNGVPVSITEDIFTTENLIILNSEGMQIPATFEVLSRWGGGKNDVTKQIQWILVSFPVSMNANTEDNFFLTEGTPVENTAPIVLTENADSYNINTGSAEFVIDKNNMTLFNSISNNTSVLASGTNGGSFSTITGQSGAGANTPTFTIERNNANYLCLKAEGDYNNTPVGTSSVKPLSYKIRYEFYAGSPNATIYHKFYWAGQNGDISYGDTIPIDRISLNLPDMAAYNSTEVYADETTHLSGTLTASETASVSQNLRTLFANPHRSDLTMGGSTTSTVFASKPMLINYSGNGALAVSIDHMKYFEPQSIVTNSNGRIEVNVMAENQYFSNYQGTWARIMISALPAGETYNDALSKNYAPLNNRLFAFPDNEYVYRSRVFEEVPLNPETAESTILQTYYERLKSVSSATEYWLNDQERYHGLMTWGSLTRYGDVDEIYNETGTGTGWDKVYAGAKHSDYHSAWKNTVFQFIMEGSANLLYDYSFMGARRMLHTQIIQPDREVSSSLMGWGYSGYGRYREDGNSSHSYFDNLYSYYYLTGDMEVIDIIKVGAETKRHWFTRRDDGSLNNQDDPPEADWVTFNSRRFAQASSSFNFIGHVDDESFLEDFLHMYHHAFSSSVVLLSNGDGKEYGFLVYGLDNSSGFRTEQGWMQSLYFFHYLYSIYNEYGDISMGSENLSISRVFKAFANTYMEYFSKISQHEEGGDGTWGSEWCNSLQVYYSGDKIGGSIISVNDGSGVDPPMMYSTGKPPIITQVLRAGFMNDDIVLKNYGFAGLSWVNAYESYIECADRPWEKINGSMFVRLVHGMSYLSDDVPPTPDNPIFEYNFDLFQNEPNPFNSETKIKYSVPEYMFVSIKVYDVFGRIVAIPVERNVSAGIYEVPFNGTNLADGQYFYKMEASGYSKTKKMLHMK